MNAELSKSQRRRRNRKNKQQTVVQTVVTRQGPSTSGNAPNPSKRSKRRSRKNRSRGSNSGYTSSNSYLRTLQSPETTPGVKVPDMVSFPTGTFTVSYEGQIPVGASTGDSCAFIGYPRMGQNGNTTTSNPGYLLSGTTSGSLSGVQSINWAAKASVNALYQAVRPVSAVLTAEYIGPSTTDGGFLIGGLLPRNYVVPTSIGSALTIPGSQTCSVRNGVRIVWKPEDNADLEFQETATSVWSPPACFVAATGQAPSTANILFKWLVNFEGVPYVDTSSFIDVSPSPISLQALQDAFNWASQSNAVSQMFQNYIGPYIRPAISAGMDALVTNYSRRNARRLLN